MNLALITICRFWIASQGLKMQQYSPTEPPRINFKIFHEILFYRLQIMTNLLLTVDYRHQLIVLLSSIVSPAERFFPAQI